MTPDADADAAGEPSKIGPAIGWLALFLSLGFVSYLHQGVAPQPLSSQWLLHTDFVGRWFENPPIGSLLLATPSALLAIVVFWGSRSSLARMLALAAIFSAGLFAFYALSGTRVWGFFQWRGSAVMVLTSVTFAAAIVAPLLARSWLRLPWPVQSVLYALVVLFVIAQLRNATGTDERLAFNFSPWPVVSIFGLEFGAYSVIGVLAGLSLAATGLALWSGQRALAAACLIGGALAPALWLAFRFGSLPPGSAGPLLVGTPIAIALTAITGAGSRRDVLLARARHLALGAILVAVPLLSGRAMATGDYTVTRFVRAQTLITALQDHFAERDIYPDSLEELLAHGYLDEIPRPRVGFELVDSMSGFDPPAFHYQSLGSSYVLEFISTEWVQCAYNPPWEDEEDYDYGDDEEDGGSSEAWSCPESRPELW